MSRFSTQLNKLYLEKESQSATYSTRPSLKIMNENTIEKSDAVQAKLEQYLRVKGLSPSALNTLLGNPQDFYLKYVLGIKEIEQREALHPSTIGSVVHNCLEATFKKFLQENDISVIKSAIANVGRDADCQLQELLSIDIERKGELQLLRSVLSSWLKRFYQFDLKRITDGVEIISLEEPISSELLICDSSTNIPIKLTGFIDRVEKEQNLLRIVDYKTGKVSSGDLKLKKVDLQSFSLKRAKAIQLMMYTYIYKGIHPGKKFIAGIYSFRNSEAGIIPLMVNGNINIEEPTMIDFENGLKAVLSDLLNPDIPFTRVEPEYENVLPF